MQNMESQRSIFLSPPSNSNYADAHSQSSPVDYRGLQNRLYDLCLEESITDVDSEGIMHFHSDSQFRGAFLEMNALRESEQLCDVVLEVGEIKISAHRVVLASLSAYFRAMFTGEMAETKKKLVSINGVDAASLKSLIEYAYTASIKISEDNVQAILPAAGALQFEEVKRACCEFLRRQLDSDNCLGIKVFAEVHGCVELHSAATVYSSHYFTQVQKRDEYLKLPLDDIKLFLRNDQLNVTSEFDVFHAAITWLLYKEERKEHVCEIINLVRMPLLSLQELLTDVGQRSLVLSDPSCVKMLMDAIHCHVLPDFKSNIEPHRLHPRKPHEKLFAIGGWDGNRAVNTVECYDTETSQWETISSTQISRNGVGLAILDGVLYAVGGHDGQRFQNTVEMFDPRVNRWKSISSLKHRRASAGLVVHDGYIYAIGGQDGTMRLRSSERYSPDKGEWECITSMNTRRDSPGVASFGDSIYAIGGCHACMFLDTVERYDPKQNKWFSAMHMSHRRSAVGAVTYKDHVYVFGGHDEQTNISTLERYDPCTDTWDILGPMNSPRAGVGAAVLNGRIVAVGGFDGTEQLSSVEQYNPEEDTWTYMTQMKHERSYVGAISMVKIV